MKKKTEMPMPPVPCRGGIGKNPVNLCHDISRLTMAHVRSANIEGVMSQRGARMVLSALAIMNEATQHEVVDMTHLRPPTVSVILRKMQDEGLVELFRNPDDMREIRARLTERGLEVDRNGIEKIKETDSLALNGIGEEDIATLMRLLGKIRENLLEKNCEKREEKEK